MNKEQKKFLRSLAHGLKAVIWIGQQGLTENVIAEIQMALNHHELIKVSVRTGDREQRDQIVNALCEMTGAEKVQKIGNTITIYKRNPKQSKISVFGENP